MQLDITKRCADSLRTFTETNFGIQLKSSHAHELVAAYFGYSSRAALLADAKCQISNLREAEFIVLTPTTQIKERRNKLNELPQNLPDDLAEGVYLPLYNEKWILHPIWPTLEELGKALADRNLKDNYAAFRDMKVQRQGVKLEFHNDEVAIVVIREYVFPGLTLELGKNVLRGVVDVFNLKRVAGFVGYVKSNHYCAEAETLDAAVVKMRDVYHTIISSSQSFNEVAPLIKPELSFTDWLKKQKNRDSPLGDLAKEMLNDKRCPENATLDAYRNYLHSRGATWLAVQAFEKAWKAYKAFLKRKNSPSPIKQKVKKSILKNGDPRTIVFVKNVKPVHYSKRAIETFNTGDKAWISWDGRKAIPVTINGVTEITYSFRIERPLSKAGDEHTVDLYEVGSTPELACINCVTF